MTIEITTVTAYFSLVMLIAGFLSGYVLKDSILENEREAARRDIDYLEMCITRSRELLASHNFVRADTFLHSGQVHIKAIRKRGEK